MPLCRDCAHCQPDLDARHPYANARCDAVLIPDYVEGKTISNFCSSARGPGGVCGIEGRLFEQIDEVVPDTPKSRSVRA